MLVINGKEVLTTLEEIVNPKHAALLLIDLQNDFVMPGGYNDKMGWDISMLRQIIPRVKVALEAARRSGVLVVHTQTTMYPNYFAESPASLHMYLLRIGYLSESSDYIEKMPAFTIKGTWGWQISDELTPLPSEIVIEKHRSSAFMATDLDLLLRCSKIKSVVIVGIVTQGCVMSTVLDAPVVGYYPVILQDCVASRSRELHEGALFIMSQKVDVANSEDVVQIWA